MVNGSLFLGWLGNKRDILGGPEDVGVPSAHPSDTEQGVGRVNGNIGLKVLLVMESGIEFGTFCT